MDIRIKRTRSQIKEAFIALRKEKPLHKITVKELCERADINKATFYLHYRSMLDLADRQENELIESCLASVKEIDLYNLRQVFYDLFNSFKAQSDLVSTLFWEDRMESIIKKTDSCLKKRLYEEYPYIQDDFEFSVRLTATLYGIYYAYLQYHNSEDSQRLLDILSQYVRLNLEPQQRMESKQQ